MTFNAYIETHLVIHSYNAILEERIGELLTGTYRDKY